jgi:hypothetical protein
VLSCWSQQLRSVRASATLLAWLKVQSNAKVQINVQRSRRKVQTIVDARARLSTLTCNHLLTISVSRLGRGHELAARRPLRSSPQSNQTREEIEEFECGGSCISLRCLEILCAREAGHSPGPVSLPSNPPGSAISNRNPYDSVGFCPVPLAQQYSDADEEPGPRPRGTVALKALMCLETRIESRESSIEHRASVPMPGPPRSSDRMQAFLASMYKDNPALWATLGGPRLVMSQCNDPSVHDARDGMDPCLREPPAPRIRLRSRPHLHQCTSLNPTTACSWRAPVHRARDIEVGTESLYCGISRLRAFSVQSHSTVAPPRVLPRTARLARHHGHPTPVSRTAFNNSNNISSAGRGHGTRVAVRSDRRSTANQRRPRREPLPLSGAVRLQAPVKLRPPRTGHGPRPCIPTRSLTSNKAGCQRTPPLRCVPRASPSEPPLFSSALCAEFPHTPLYGVSQHSSREDLFTVPSVPSPFGLCPTSLFCPSGWCCSPLFYSC